MRAPDDNVFVPPLNLIEIFLLVPFEFILSKERYRRLNMIVLAVLYAPYLAVIALYESHIHNQRTQVADGDFEDDDLEDDDIGDNTRDWYELCQKGLPSTETDMDVLEQLREKLKTVEELLKMQQQ